MHIFLSYASEDVGLAHEVRLALTGGGYEVFLIERACSPQMTITPGSALPLSTVTPLSS